MLLGFNVELEYGFEYEFSLELLLEFKYGIEYGTDSTEISINNKHNFSIDVIPQGRN